MTDLPGFDHVPATTAGGTYIDVPWRIVLHTTEGSSVDGAIAAYRGHGSWPHLTVDPSTKRRVQHYPLGVSARALLNLAGGVETNRARAIQIEIVGRAGETHTWPVDWLDWLGAEVIAPIRAEVQVALVAPRFVGTEAGTIATASAPQRMSPEVWLGFNGICGHQHVCENHHWDPGRIDIDRILAAANPVEDDMDTKQAMQLQQTFERVSDLTDNDHEKLRRIIRQEVRGAIDPKALAKRIGKALPDLPPADAAKLADAIVDDVLERLGND